MEVDPRKFIYAGMSEVQILYIKERLGNLLNQSLLEVLHEAKSNGDFDEFLKTKGLEDKQYKFMRTDANGSAKDS